MSDVLVEFHSSWTGSFTGVRTNSSGNAAIQVRNPLYDNYWFVTLPEIYGDNVVADVDLRIPDSDDPVVTTVGLTASSSVISEGSSVTFTAIVKDQNGDVMSGELVTFKEGSTTLGTGTTNSSGVATLTKSGLSVGVHSIMALAGSVNSSLVTVTVNAVPVATSLTLSNTKEVLSAYDGDSTVLSATVRDQFDELMSGASVVFKVNGVTKDTVVTNSSGVASYTYAGVGVGDVTFTVECGLLQETYSIQDLKYYDSLFSNKGHWTIPSGANVTFGSTGMVLGSSSSWKDIYLEIPISKPCEIEYDVVSWTGTSSYHLYFFDSTKANRLFHLYRSGDGGGRTVFTNYPNYDTYTSQLPQSCTVKIKVLSDSLELYVDGDYKISKTYTMDSPLIIGVVTASNRTTTYKNLKIKPL